MAWEAATGSTLVATVARVRHTGGVEAWRRTIGAVSRMRGLLYWSTSHQEWQPLIIDAAALDGPTGARRKDFSADEVAAGAILHVEQQDNLLGTATYLLRVLQATPDGLVFGTEYSSTIRYLGLPVANAGAVQSVTFLTRESKDVWRYYSLARTGAAVSLLTGGHEASLINRAVATFRYLAGIPADREPPASR
jgi:hypothetical protein